MKRLEHRYRKTLKYEIDRYITFLRKYENACKRRDNSSSIIASKYWTMLVKLYDRKKNIL